MKAITPQCDSFRSINPEKPVQSVFSANDVILYDVYMRLLIAAIGRATDGRDDRLV